MQIRPRLSTRRSAPLVFAAAALFAAAAAPAEAADVDVGIGIGGGIGAADGRVDCVASFPCDRSSTSWKLFVDWRPTDAFDLQAVGFGAGRFKGGDTAPSGAAFGGSFKVDGLGFTGGYRWVIAPAWSLVGRAGLASVRTRFEYADSSLGAVSKTTVQPLLGLGLAWQLTPAVGVGLDYDVTRFKAHSTQGALHMLGVTAQYSF
ncbi:MAG: outer membrane beta-barrel protein [Caldimonas sp.]